MDEQNPYSAPDSEVALSPAGETFLGGLDFDQLKKLYHRSCNVNAITFLMALGMLLLSTLFLVPTTEEGIPRWFIIAMIAFYGGAVVGLFKRTSWGRILGIVTSIISLVNVPLGTIIGIAGLFAFFGAPQLFGPDRLTHRELKAEFNTQKAIRKQAKKDSR